MRLGPRLAASSATASSKSKVAACTGHADQLHCRAASGLASDVPSGQTGKTVAGCQFEVASVSEVSLLLVTADRVASQVPPSHSNRHSRKCSCPLLSSFSPRLLRVHPLELHRGEPPSPDTADEEEAGAEIVEVRSLFRLSDVMLFRFAGGVLGTVSVRKTSCMSRLKPHPTQANITNCQGVQLPYIWSKRLYRPCSEYSQSYLRCLEALAAQLVSSTHAL